MFAGISNKTWTTTYFASRSVLPRMVRVTPPSVWGRPIGWASTGVAAKPALAQIAHAPKPLLVSMAAVLPPRGGASGGGALLPQRRLRLVGHLPRGVP